MPRTIFDKKPKNLKLGVLINGSIQMADKSTDDIANILDCCPNTARARLRDPGSMTVDDLRALGRALHIPIDELRDAIQY